MFLVCDSIAIYERGSYQCTRLAGHDQPHVYFNLATNELVAWDE